MKKEFVDAVEFLEEENDALWEWRRYNAKVVKHHALIELYEVALEGIIPSKESLALRKELELTYGRFFQYVAQVDGGKRWQCYHSDTRTTYDAASGMEVPPFEDWTP